MPSLGIKLGIASGSALSGAVAPTLTSATINSAGTSLSLLFSSSVSFGAGGNGGWTIAPKYSTVLGSATLSYTSGSGTNTLVYTISRAIYPSSVETATISYVQPGSGVQGSGVDLASLGPISCTNNSTTTSGETFIHDFESRDAQIFGGDGTGVNPGGTGSSISSEQALDGSKSLKCEGTGFPLNEFNTDPSINPDFNWAEGRIVAHIYVPSGPAWPSGSAQFFSVKNELGTTANRVLIFRGGVEGSIRFLLGNTSSPVTLTGVTRDTWHKVTLTWNESGPAGVYATAQLNSGTAVNRTVSLPAADADPTQILQGNDTATAATFYLGGLFRVWDNSAGT